MDWALNEINVYKKLMIKEKKMRAKIPFMLLICIALSMINTVYATSENPKSSQALPSAVTVPDDFSTLQEALNNAEHGVTVYLKEGVYSIASPITIAQNVSIIGSGQPTVEFCGEGKIVVKTDESAEIKKDAPIVTFEGIKFIGKFGESEFKELEILEAALEKRKKKEINNLKERLEFAHETSALFKEVADKSKAMTEKYSLFTVLEGSLSIKGCTVSCDSGAAFLIVGKGAFLTASDSLFEKNGFDAVVVTESEVSFDSCTFAQNRRCPVVLKRDAKGILANCKINDSLFGLSALEDSELVVEKTLASGCYIAISCCDDSMLRLTEGQLINSNLGSINVIDYSKAIVTGTVFLDAPVHIKVDNHSQTEVYGSTFTSGNVGVLTAKRKASVQFDDNCKFHDIKYKLLDEATIVTTHDKSLFNLMY